ncbi:MAG: MFS transporter [Actinomycetales bacterium]|nr:MFS transporter [Actinomycetales bacterium]
MTAPETARAETPARPPVPRRTWLALAVLLAGAFMALLDTTIVNVALPVIRDSIDADEATLSWIISGYALAYGLALIPAGRFGDRFGHKGTFLVGIAVFTAASLWCALAPDGTSLIVARVVQGLGGGIFFPAITALIQLEFPPQRRGQAFAIMGAVIGVSTALGPIVGGLLIQAFGEGEGWRSIFLVNLPLGVLAIVAAALVLRRGGESDRLAADWAGLALLAGGLVAILVPLIQGEDAGWPAWTWISIGGGLALIVSFALWEIARERRGRVVLVPPRLFRHPAFAGGALLALVYFAAFTSIFFSISILWQAGLGHTALESGLVSIPFAIGNIVGASQSDRLAARLGRSVLVIGVGLVAASLIAIWLILALVPTTELTNWDLLAPLALGGLGSGLFIAPNAQFIVATVDRADAGAASGVIGTVQRVGAAVGIAIIGSILFGTLDVPAAPTPTDLANAFGTSASWALLTSACFAVVAFALVFALPRRLERAGGRPAEG